MGAPLGPPKGPGPWGLSEGILTTDVEIPTVDYSQSEVVLSLTGQQKGM